MFNNVFLTLQAIIKFFETNYYGAVQVLTAQIMVGVSMQCVG